MHIGTQLYVFHQLYHRRGKDLPEHLPEVLRQVEQAGIEGCESNLGFLPAHGETVRATLAETGLELPSVYAGGGLHSDELAAATVPAVLRDAPLAVDLGATALSFNPQPRREPRKTDAELRRQADGLNELGRGLRELGLRLNVHTHDPEMLDDAREFRSLLDLTDPEAVGLCLDTHWVYRGGGDVLALTIRYADRVGLLHVRQSHGGVWAEAFEPGDLDHEAIADVLRTAAFDGWVMVELALEAGTPETRPVVDNLRLSGDYARKLFID